MPSGSLPFRTTLRAGSEETAAPETMALMLEVAEAKEGVEPALFRRVLTLGYEPLLLLAIPGYLRTCRALPASERRQGIELCEELVARLREAAWREGVLWTPLLDQVLAHHALNPVEQEAFSPAWEQLKALRPWMEEASEVELDAWLCFRSRGAQALAARYAGALSPAQIRRLGERDRLALLKNPRVPAREKEGVLQRCWEAWLADFPGPTRMFQDGRRRLSSSEGGLLRTAAQVLPEGFPASLREEMLGKAREVEVDEAGREAVLATLAADRHLSSPMLEEVMERGSTEARAGVLSHPNTSSSLLARTLEVQDGAQAAARALSEKPWRERLTAARIAEMVRGRYASPGVLGAAGNHPETPAEIWREILPGIRLQADRGKLYRILADLPAAREQGEVFEEILAYGESGLVARLFPLTDPERYTRAWLFLWAADREQARALWTASPAPAGVRLPNAVLAELLTSENAEERLQTLARLSELQETATSFSPAPFSARR